MNDLANAALSDALAYLVALEVERVDSSAALARLSELQARHPQLKLNLVWQRSAHEARPQYDLLVGAEAGTVSLSWCARSLVPFPLRGVQRMSEWDLVHVDGVPLLVSEAVEALELLWNEVRLLERIIDTCIIKGEIDRDPIDIDDDELQVGVDRFRAVRGLGSIDATERWLRGRGLTLGTLEAIVRSELRVRKLRGRVAGAEAERRFHACPSDFDALALLAFSVADEATARALTDEIRTGGLDFMRAGEQTLLRGNGQTIQLARCLRRQLELAPQPSSEVEPGAVVAGRVARGPWSVARVVTRTAARLDAATRDTLEALLFDQWLAARRASARIEWNWGPSDD